MRHHPWQEKCETMNCAVVLKIHGHLCVYLQVLLGTYGYLMYLLVPVDTHMVTCRYGAGVCIIIGDRKSVKQWIVRGVTLQCFVWARPRGDALRAKPLHIDLSIQHFQHFNEHFLLLLIIIIFQALLIKIKIALIMAMLMMIMGVGMKRGGASSCVMDSSLPAATIHHQFLPIQQKTKLHYIATMQSSAHCSPMYLILYFFYSLGLGTSHFF